MTSSGSVPPSGRAPRRRLPGRRIAPFLFVLPNLAVFGLFTIWPAINGFRISLYDSSNGRQFEYVGIDNYRRILSDDEFWTVARNTILFVAGFVIAVTVLSTVLALLLDAQIRWRGALRAAYFLPVVISPVVVGLIWSWMFTRRTGVVNAVLDSIGLGRPRWLLDKKLAMAVVIAVAVWTHVGFYSMILLSGLKGIPDHVHEAGRIDGASTMQRIRLITLPLLRPTTLVVVVLATIAGFQAFDLIYTLTGGGPVGGTTLIVQFIYERAFQSPIQYGLASAAGVIFFLVVFSVTLLNYLVGRRRDAV